MVMKFQVVDNRERYNAKIKVIGIGGAGGNAINNMIEAKLQGVEFITANTDSQDLERSSCSSKIQLGGALTKGLGSGADPDIGRLAAEFLDHQAGRNRISADTAIIPQTE